MTEAEWLSSDDPISMVPFVADRASHRKFRLLTVACCRRVWHLLPPTRQRWVEVAERYADGAASDEEMEAASASECRWLAGGPWFPQHFTTGTHPGWVAWHVLAETAASASYAALEEVEAQAGSVEDFDDEAVLDAGQAAEYREQAILLRDIVTPFRAVSVPAAWRPPAVLRLAGAAYELRSLPAGTLEPDALAVLADALEEAGCSDRPTLDHLRGPGPHVRGCHVVDALLEKE